MNPSVASGDSPAGGNGNQKLETRKSGNKRGLDFTLSPDRKNN